MNAPVNTELKFRTFESKILYFNGMYRLPVAPYPQLEMQAQHEVARLEKLEGRAMPEVTLKDSIQSRLENFRKIISDEVKEVDEIIGKLNSSEGFDPLDILTDLADWLGDLQVFAASENARFGIPNNEVLSVIMSSNFSKLGPNGEPIYDSNGKVQKGPGYWKPEPMIRQLLIEKIQEGKEPAPTGIIWREEGK